ncbi:MAG: hypothetical protein KDD58_12005 [Bdellovibrionales bacterium]|nr:hypothetical protein [Bdellovibrionales bacterium]
MQENSIYILNQEDLLSGNNLKGSHPLIQISNILTDLENWHKSNRKLEAALEAQLERYRLIASHFKTDIDKAIQLKFLIKLLRTTPNVSWKSMVYAEIVKFYFEENKNNSLILSRNKAKECIEKYPKTTGAQYCQHYFDRIEEKDFKLQSMFIDGENKRSLELNYKNINKIYLFAYKRNLNKLLVGKKDYNLFPDKGELTNIISTEPYKKWSFDLRLTEDFKSHKKYLDLDLDKNGYYIIVASKQDDPRQKKDNKIIAINYIQSKYLIKKERMENGGWRIYTVTGDKGEIVPNANVKLYKQDYKTGFSVVRSDFTNENGYVEFNNLTPRFSYIATAEKEKDITLDKSNIHFGDIRSVRQSKNIILYQDRGVYRPGQKIFVKVLGFQNTHLDKSKYEPFAENTDIEIELKDANYKTVQKQKAKTNKFGTAHVEFLIPKGRLLGQWTLRAKSSNVNTHSQFLVEEYKRPTFLVELQSPKQAIRLNQKSMITGDVKYYYGLPVTEGKVKWKIYRQTNFPWWWSWYHWGSSSSYEASEQMIASGVELLNKEGLFSISFKPQADENLKHSGVIYNYRLMVDVTDLGGETQSAERNYSIGFVDVKANIATEKNYFMAGSPVNLKVLLSSLNNKPLSGKGNWKLYTIKQPSKTRPLSEEVQSSLSFNKNTKDYTHLDDKKYPRWRNFSHWSQVSFHWSKRQVVTAGSINHNNAGQADISIKSLKSGFYRIIYQTQDKYGAEFKTQKDFYVVSEKNKLHFPLIVDSQKFVYEPGEVFKLFVHSGFKNQTINYVIRNNEEVLKSGSIKSNTTMKTIDIPIEEKHRGGFSYQVYTINDYQMNSIQGHVSVPWSNKELNIEFETFRDRLRPGVKEKFKIVIKNKIYNERIKETAEVLSYMYDKSLDVFNQLSPKSPLQFFPNHSHFKHPLTTNLSLAPESYIYGYNLKRSTSVPYLNSDSFRFLTNYGIGGLGNRGRGYTKGLAVPSSAPRELDDAYAETEALSEDESRFGGRASAKMQVKRAKSDTLPSSKESVKASSVDVNDVQIRKNFNETAYWQPQLLTDENGEAYIEFEVPDSLTSWNLWVQAVTKNLSSGLLKKELQTVKELMIRPYLPRFLREGDRGELKIAVNNSSNQQMKVNLTAEIIDPQTEKNILKEFGIQSGDWNQEIVLAPSSSKTVSIYLNVPAKIQEVSFKIKGTSGLWSDGELRSLPILPSRMHLMESKFVTLKQGNPREVEFVGMRLTGDDTRINKQLVITLDAQLIYSVLSALPYLVNYPYECTEQTLNRFISTAILNKTFAQHPAIKKMASKFSKERRTQFEKWNEKDPNRMLLLEESPWLSQAQGGGHSEEELIKVLDPQISKLQMENSLKKIQQSQTSVGGFPWYPGGAPSPHITMLVIHGFSKALEFGVDLPKPMIVKAWNYLYKHFREHELKKHSLHLLVYLNYLASSFPDSSWTGKFFTDQERKTILDYTFLHWRELSPYLKAYLSLSLYRMQKSSEAKLVFDSIMDSAKTTEDQGTYWAAEDRSWLWYNDTIESHAFVLRAMTEMYPKDNRREGLVKWLFINKKLNHWKSTRATAEVLYSLVHYLKTANQLGIREQIDVKIGSENRSFIFEPENFDGKNKQWVIPGPQINPKQMAKIHFEKKDPALGFASATWHYSTEQLPSKGVGDFLSVERKYYLRQNEGGRMVLKAISEGQNLEIGDEIEVHLSIRAKHQFEYVHLRDPRAAGLEPGVVTSGWEWDLGLPRYKEIRDSATNFFFEYLPMGEYTLKYRAKAQMSGQFRVGPAQLQAMYAPEFGAFSSGKILKIK